MNHPTQFFISLDMAGCGNFYSMRELCQKTFEPVRNDNKKKGNKII